MRAWRESALDMDFRSILYVSELLNVVWTAPDVPGPVTTAAWLVTWTSDSLSLYW